MGQNSSNPVSSPRAGEKRTQSQRPEPPHSKPLAPTLPNHVVAENKVLHNGIGTMSKARGLLRQVSQELTQYHPEYADIFQYDQHDDTKSNGDNDKENSDLKSSFVAASENPLSNGHISKSNGIISTDTSVNNPASSNQQNSSNLRRTYSLDRRLSNAIPVPRHRRQSSLTAGTSLQAVTILEDPREHLYNITRHEPFSNNMPSTTSLPMKNSYEGDYSMNLTYAQLAEYRRQKRMSELEEKTGKKLGEMSAEIRASNTVPKSPFDRQNFNAKPGSQSVSTRSSGTGLSKSKKKKAPQPPISASANATPRTPRRDKSPGSFSLNTEPPVDYDMDDVIITSAVRQPRSGQRSTSRTSNSFKTPVVSALPNAKSYGRQQIPIDKVYSPRVSSENLDKIRIPPAPPVPKFFIKPDKIRIPPAPPVPKSFTKPVSMSVASTNNAKTEKSDNKAASKLAFQKSIAEAKEQLEALKKLEDVLKNYRTTDDKDIPETDRTNVDQESVVFSGAKDGADPNEGPSSSSSKTTLDQKKMSSLLQHDIMLAAKARGSKQKKSKAPAVLEKPKDAAQLFREELAKAASERETRRQERIHSNGHDSVKISESSDEDKRNHKNEPVPQLPDFNMGVGDSDQDMISIDSNLSFEKQQTNQVENVSLSGSSGSRRVFSPTWTPEDDLGSDEDTMNQSYTRPEANISTEGFKSSLVPTKLNELKNYTPRQQKKMVNKPPSQNYSFDETEQRQNGNDKFGSIRNFRRSVHEGMKNAFGSISKASGKLLKKQKSCDSFEVFGEYDKAGDVTRDSGIGISPYPNWEMSGNYKGSHRRRLSDGSISIPYTNGVNDSDTSENDSDVDDIGDIDFASGLENTLTHRGSKKSKSPGDPKNLKRAGVAYVDKNGQMFVLPENADKFSGDSNKPLTPVVTPRLYKKKNKKKNNESPRKQQERSRLEESLSKELIEKERQLEEDRKRQRDLERDFLRLRDLETQERLQRQIAMLQYQQMNQAHLNLNSDASGLIQMDPTRNMSNGGPIPSSFTPTAHQNVHSSYLPHGQNGHTGGKTIQSQPLTGVGASQMTSHQTGTAASFPTTVLGQPITHSSLAAPINSSPFVTHTSPMIGGGITSVGTPSPFPNFTSQDLGHLSEYMTTRGVAPPSNQQQWAVLLSTIRINTPRFDGFTPRQGNDFPSGFTRTSHHGPNLSTIFGGTGGKTLERTLITSVMEETKKDAFANNIDELVQTKQNARSSQVSNLESPDPKPASETFPFLVNGDSYVDNDTKVIEESKDDSEVSKDGSEVSKDDSEVSKDGSEVSKDNSDPAIDDTASNAQDTTAVNPTLDLSVQLGDELDTSKAAQVSKQVHAQLKTVRSPTMSPKVYGPIGFRPVVFNTASS